MKWIALVMTPLLMAFTGDQPLNDNSQLFRSFELKDGNVLSKPAELQTWVGQQNTKTRQLLDQVALKPTIQKRFAELAPTNAPLKTYLASSALFLRAGSLFLEKEGTETMLIDKATLNGSSVTDFRVSPDETKLTYQISKNGSDSLYWYFYDLQSRTTLSDSPIRTRIYPINWKANSQGVYYSVWPSLEEETKLVHAADLMNVPVLTYAEHLLGQPAESDKTVFAPGHRGAVYEIADIPNTNLMTATRIKSGFMHALAVFMGERKTGSSIQWKQVSSSRHLGRLLGADEKYLYLFTSESGNNMGIVRSPTSDTKKIEPLISNSKSIMYSAQKVGRYLVCFFATTDYQNSVKVYDLDGNLHHEWTPLDLGLSLSGTFSGPLVVANSSSEKGTFSYSSVDQVPVTIEYDIASKKMTALKPSKEIPFSGAKIKSQFLEIEGTYVGKIPMLIYSRTDVPPKFIYMYYYGSNGTNNGPSYNRKFQMALESGAAIAFVGARGGFEKGASWYQEGMMDRFSTIHDLKLAADWLRANVPSELKKVVAVGRSYGGLATNGLLAHFPESADIFVPVAPIADPIYFMTDYFGAFGWDDMGLQRDQQGQITASDDTLEQIYRWSPLAAAVEMKTAPAVLTFTADQDERTGPHQAYLMTDLLQQKFPQASVYMFEYEKAGHFARAETVDEMLFIHQQFQLTEYLPLVP